MATISNPSFIPIVLPTGHVLPRLGVLDVDNDTIRASDNWPMLRGMMLAGQVTLTFDPEPTPEENVAVLKKAAAELRSQADAMETKAAEIEVVIAAAKEAPVEELPAPEAPAAEAAMVEEILVAEAPASKSKK